MPQKNQLCITCFTRRHGIHKVDTTLPEDGLLPESLTFRVPYDTEDKFDPRLNWDAWVGDTEAHTGRLIRMEKIAGTVYAEISLPFITNLRKYELTQGNIVIS